MIYFHAHELDGEVAKLVVMSFIRSYTKTQVCHYVNETSEAGVHVFVNPREVDYELVCALTSGSTKLIILGSIPSNIAELLGLEVAKLPEDSYLWDRCDAAPIHGFTESAARIRYENLPDSLECHISGRALLRYDFAKEWNNLGYGHVRTDGSMWSIACRAKYITTESTQLATVYQGNEFLTLYVSLATAGSSEVLWVNRAAGLMDSHEFRLIETFISNYKCDSLPCLPLLREIPYGYDAIISMRLDCDEDIASARPLFELYKSCSIPFSLALKTGQPIENVDKDLIDEVVQNNGSVLSHSVNHKVNWGVDFEDARIEAEKSRQDILDITDVVTRVEYAVSPFHQNPEYAVVALDNSGYKGFVGGIICNDQQYLVSRGGRVSSNLSIITHSQQCMLHGDCVLKSTDDSLAVFKQCVSYAVRSGAAFGFLDHPFSERYQYGWMSEEQRIAFHTEWIRHLNDLGNVLFESEVNMLEHIRKKSNINIWLKGDVVKSSGESSDFGYPLAYEFKGVIASLPR